MNDNKLRKYSFIGLLMIYLFTPLFVTFLYSFADKWQTTIFPEGITFEWYDLLFHDIRFLFALKKSFVVSGLTVMISLIIMIPTIFIVVVYFPKLEKILKILITLPFAMPGIVSAVGLIKLYSSGIMPIAGTIWILLGAYFVIILPFMYQGIRNSLRTIDVNTLMEAANLLGASEIEAFLKVILPNMLKGILVSSLLSFSVLFGEFVIANILAGGNYETVQVYLFSQKGRSGHFTSAIVISYFTFILLISFVIVKINKLIDTKKG